MLLPVVGCPNVFTNDDEEEEDDEASFLPSSSSFGFFLVEGALSSGWSENIGRLCCDGDSIEGVVVTVVDASSSTYEFTGTIGKKKEDAPPPSPPPLRVVAPLIVLSWAFWVKSLVKKRVV